MDISQEKQRLRDAIISGVRQGYTKVVEKAVEKTKKFEEKYFVPPTPGDLLDFCHLEKPVMKHDWYEAKVLFQYAQIMHSLEQHLTAHKISEKFSICYLISSTDGPMDCLKSATPSATILRFHNTCCRPLTL